MSDWSIAIRNLRRNRRRSLSTLLALAIGLIAILLFSGFKANLGSTMLTSFVRAGGHLQIQHRDYFLYGSGNPTAYGISGYDALLAAIRADAPLRPMLHLVTPMLRLGGLAGNFDAGISRTVIGTGYVAAEMAEMRRWNEYAMPTTDKRFSLEGAAADAAVVGIGVARVLQLCAPLHVPGCKQPEVTADELPASAGIALPADIAALASAEHGPDSGLFGDKKARIELLSNSSRGAPNVIALTVVAAEDQGFKELDEVSVILHLATAQKLVFGRAEPRVTALMVQLNRSDDRFAAAQRLRQILAASPGGAALTVRDFEELNPFYSQSENLFNVIFGFIFVLIGGIVLFTVGNTMNAAVVERTVEIGTLRAIGLRQSGIRKIFVIEGFLLGCFGAIAGIVLAVLIGELVNRSGLTWLPPGSSEPLPLQVRVLADGITLAGASLGLVFVATLSAWWPAWRAASLSVVEALRHA
jgi:putative ABC transport system permease protein